MSERATRGHDHRRCRQPGPGRGRGLRGRRRRAWCWSIATQTALERCVRRADADGDSSVRSNLLVQAEVDSMRSRGARPLRPHRRAVQPGRRLSHGRGRCTRRRRRPGISCSTSTPAAAAHRARRGAGDAGQRRRHIVNVGAFAAARGWRDDGRLLRLEVRRDPPDRVDGGRTARPGHQRQLRAADHHRHARKPRGHARCRPRALGRARRTWPTSSLPGLGRSPRRPRRGAAR